MNPQTTYWSAPAKLNLFLHINGRRPDGYHELQTLFQFIEEADRLAITPDHSGQISLTPAIPGVPLEANLIYRAAQLLKPYAKPDAGAAITLEKVLPMGGGLGGGSSDAATTLVALNHLWKTELQTDQLAELGLQLGADVPVFIRGHAALAEGVGEQLSAVEPEEKWYLIAVPNTHICTATIFQDPALPRDTPKQSLSHLMQGEWRNDFQEVVKKRHPEVANILTWLLEYAPSRLTGSGSCLFAEFANKQSAKLVLQQAPRWFKGFVSKGRNISPLMLELEAARAALGGQ